MLFFLCRIHGKSTLIVFLNGVRILGKSGHRRNWGKHFLSSQTQSLSAIFLFCQEGNNNILFCQSQFSFCQNINKCFSLKTTEKMCKNDKNWQKNCPNWQKAGKYDRKTGKMLSNSEMLGMFCVCSFKLSISFLPNYQYQPLHLLFLSCRAN